MKPLLSILFLLFMFNINAQTYDWLWLHGVGGLESESGVACATDSQDNTIVVGVFNSDQITFGTNTLYNSSINRDMFVVSYDVDGNVNWAKRFGSTGQDNISDVSVDAQDNIYIAGNFGGSTIDIDAFPLTNATAPEFEIFLAKLNSSGTVLWANSFGGTGSEIANTVKTDVSGNVYMGGNFQSSALSFGGSTFSSQGFWDAFIAKFDSNGSHLWSAAAGGTDRDEILDVTVDPGGKVTAVGTYESASIDFGGGNLSNVSTGVPDAFIVQWDAQGNHLWSLSEGGDNYDTPYSVASDTLGNLYVAGSFNSSLLSFGPYSLNNSSSSSDLFLVKLNSSGSVQWALSDGGSDDDMAYTVEVDPNQNVVIGGEFYSPFLFEADPNELHIQGLYIAKFSSDGTLQMTGGRDFDGSSGGWNAVWGIGVQSNNGYTMVGDFSNPTLWFDFLFAQNQNGGGMTSSDMYIVRLGNTAGLEEVESAPGTLVKVTDYLGRETSIRKNTPQFYHYSNGVIRKQYIIEN